MKKLMIAVATALVMCACGAKTAEVVVPSDSVAVETVDTLAVDSVAVDTVVAE